MGFDLQQIRKERDPHFRQQVLRAYNYECAICGFNMRHDNTSVALEAAHIKWKQHGGPCEIPNGLALCAIHHKAFDKGSIGLDEDMRIQVSPAVNGGASLAGYSGILMVSRLPYRREKNAIRRKGLWRGTGGRCSGGEGVW
ncbi:restriction endonuclease [Klebsiella pneumoniae]|nr:restriction endonuclease [Klebsiella pneumoniae]